MGGDRLPRVLPSLIFHPPSSLVHGGRPVSVLSVRPTHDPGLTRR